MFTLMALIENHQYEASFDTLELAETKRDALVERGAKHWIILDDDGANTREVAKSA